ncbi:MAG TPA: phosphatidylserine decarboxylase [Caldisericia bacterium]|nr:phosphatidylserine decarboxylase [Caldisericia bacterium]HPF49072.1 phosphatidylserine decarboxylase [Caldisericia bacterium]HPI83064.1 phosphatidylserine decarboxylase [Caldisericia bacterium]HPQ92291.1 phosphatidylserine decarboxylase [Caldisericia bacterium]HRV74611.1 phosphatidylserine decarboxylase [Caldisericia bacterium]
MTWLWWTLGSIAVFIVGEIIFQHWKRNIWFFRDPKINSPEDDGSTIIAPCCGRVMYVKEITDGKVICEKLDTKIEVTEISKSKDAPKTGILIGIYMSPFDVHFNYAPIGGKITSITHTQAKLNLPMVDLWEYIQFVWLRRAVNLLGRKFHLQNERNTVVIESSKCKLAMVEIADKVVNKIDCFVKNEETISLGQKISFIKRGSQVDLMLYGTNYKINTKVGDHVTGGVTIVAKVSN